MNVRVASAAAVDDGDVRENNKAKEDDNDAVLESDRSTNFLSVCLSIYLSIDISGSREAELSDNVNRSAPNLYGNSELLRELHV